MASTDLLLPVFFFHGLTRNASDGGNLKEAFAAQGRVLVALSFASNEKSRESMHKQIPLAIEQIRSIVASDDRFKNGYIFMGHSQGAILARAVVEEMDDHQVHTLIGLAGPQAGLFYGSQAVELGSLGWFFKNLGPEVLPTDAFDYESYRADPSTWRGKFQRDFAKFLLEHKELQDKFSFANFQRAPSVDDWLASNTFLPKMNNLNKCESAADNADQKRRKDNFLKLRAAHFFISPSDGAVTPWQSSIFGRYNEVSTIDEIEAKFEDFKIVDMCDTAEYVGDTFGLKTLDKRGGLHLHVAPNVPHDGWFMDTQLSDGSMEVCVFKTVFEKFIMLAFA